MKAITCIIISAALVASTVFAQGNATAAALTAVDAGYAALDLELEGNSGFGVNLTSTALITATYPRGQIVNGRTYPPSRLSTQPNITITPSDTFDASATFTLTLADASALDDPDNQGNYRHFLASSLSIDTTGPNGSLVLAGGVTVTDYVGPGPFAGTGVHRYSWLLFSEPQGFTAPANLSAPGTGPGHWYVADCVQQTGVTLVAATFFLATFEGDATSASAGGGGGASSTVASAPIRTRTSIPLTASATAFLSSLAL